MGGVVYSCTASNFGYFKRRKTNGEKSEQGTHDGDDDGVKEVTPVQGTGQLFQKRKMSPEEDISPNTKKSKVNAKTIVTVVNAEPRDSLTDDLEVEDLEAEKLPPQATFSTIGHKPFQEKRQARTNPFERKPLLLNRNVFQRDFDHESKNAELFVKLAR